MLTVTDDAKDLVRSVVTSPQTDEGSVLRLAQGGDGELHLALADGAEVDDQVVQDVGGRLTVDAQAAVLVDDAVLDTAVVDDTPTFVLSAPAE